jgi:hypothetical protein
VDDGTIHSSVTEDHDSFKESLRSAEQLARSPVRTGRYLGGTNDVTYGAAAAVSECAMFGTAGTG